MPDPTWREMWSPFRVTLIEETAECFADGRSAATAGAEPPWAALSDFERRALTENIAWIFYAMDQAMAKLDERGNLP
jgi:hypothetical protein